MHVSLLPHSTAAFPENWAGRLPHLVSFEACSAFTHVPACMLAGSPEVIRYIEASTDLLPPPPLDYFRLERPVAGWDLHPLDVDAFSRRTGFRTLRGRRREAFGGSDRFVPAPVRAIPLV